MDGQQLNERNYEYLKDQVKFTGFGEGHYEDLKVNMLVGNPTFLLKHEQEFGNDKAEARLHFRRLDEGDMYFFNKYDIQLSKNNSDSVLKQTFYVGKENTFTLKEAYNLLAGRSVYKEGMVNKEGEKYDAWIKLDFKNTDDKGNFKFLTYTKNYGFNLEAVLGRYPIKELDDPTAKSRLMESLQRGNRQAVTFLVDDKEQKRFIEANAQYKTITMYSSNMRRIKQGKSQGEAEGEAEEQSEKKGIGKGVSPGNGDGNKTEREQYRQGQGIS